VATIFNFNDFPENQLTKPSVHTVLFKVVSYSSLYTVYTVKANQGPKFCR